MLDIEYLLKELQELLQDRKQGNSKDQSFQDIATVWSILTGTEITKTQVAQMMIALKLIRNKTSNKRDNALDSAGYAILWLSMLDLSNENKQG